MDYLQLWKDGWNYYKKNPSFAVPYLIWFALVVSLGLFLPSLVRFSLSILTGSTGAIVLLFLSLMSALALAAAIVSRLIVGWALEMIRLVDAGEEISLKGSFNSYKGKIPSYIGASILQYALVFIAPILIVLTTVLLTVGPQSGLITNFTSSGQLTGDLLSSLVEDLLNPYVLLVTLLSFIYMVITSFLLLFVDQSVIVSGKNAVGAIKNSVQFVRGNLASVFLFIIIYAVITSLLLIPPSLFFAALAGLLVNLTGIGALGNVVSVLSSLYQFLISPLLLAAMVLYFVRRSQDLSSISASTTVHFWLRP